MKKSATLTECTERMPAKLQRNSLLCGWVFALLIAAGCEQKIDETPEDALTTWVTAMNASRNDPSARERAYTMLSSRAKEQLAQRAAVAIQLSGRDIKPWEILAPGRFALRFAFDRARLRSQVDGTNATVTARGPGTEVAEVPMVLENGHWRVALELPPWTGTNRQRR